MYPTKVAYPCPPPTNNTLSSHQRSQLLRTTTKLGRILGTTPALLEESEEMPTPIPLNLQRLAVPLHAALSSKYTDDDALVRYPSSGSDTLFSSDYDTPSYMKRSPSVASDRSRSSFESAKSMPIESWPRPQTERPYLRVAIHNSPSKLADIPQSPPAYSVHAPGPNAYPHQHTSYTIAPARSPHAPAAPHGQAFAAMPSQNSMRRQKMDKLRRTLGENVPLDMVFPGGGPGSSPAPSPLSSSDEDLPAHVRRHGPPPPRIRAARDSMLLPNDARVAPPTSREAKKLSMIAEREEAPRYYQPGRASYSSASASERGSVDSERYEGDTEAEREREYVRSQRRASYVKRVPVPAA
ncbi:hypothetical protein MKEN_00509300 [Mycena kentingensis (nom. inval.)]|nr:hypothetical protein MKEN_00509300 [Mycena kentingensis (nom. inval.)]